MRSWFHACIKCTVLPGSHQSFNCIVEKCQTSIAGEPCAGDIVSIVWPMITALQEADDELNAVYLGVQMPASPGQAMLLALASHICCSHMPSSHSPAHSWWLRTDRWTQEC